MIHPLKMAALVLRRLRPFRFLAVLALFAGGCHLPVGDKVENTLSFDRIADSLKQFDKVVIVLESLAGDTVDVVFDGKVNDSGDVRRLKAPHWDGGIVVVSITGMVGGKVVYQVETRFDAAANTRDNIVVFVSPDAKLTSTVEALTLLVGDSLGYPPIDVAPPALLDKALEWVFEPAGLLVPEDGHLKAAQAGNGMLTAALKSNPSAKVSIPFSIAASGLVPESLTIEPESLMVAAGGAPGAFTAKVLPSAAAQEVIWTSSDTSLATVDAMGRVLGKKRGEATITASSRTRLSVKNTARVLVSAPIPVEKIAFVFASQDIPIGVAESLLVIVSPPGASPAVNFFLSDPSKATVQNGKITGASAATLSVIAVSASNPDAKDTLLVHFKAAVEEDTVPPGKPTVRVTPAGPTRERRPTWSWTSGGNGGAGAYQVSLDKTVFDTSAISLADTAYRPAENLGIGTHILYVRERDAAGNWSQAGEAQVEIDTAGPSAPVILGTSPTSSLPRWTWSSGGNGGAGKFRFRLGDALFPANAPESQDTAFALTTAATGTTYTLFVQERDAAGNWSMVSSHPIKYDLTKPNVTITLPQASGVFLTAAATVAVSGTCAGPNGIASIEYALDGGAASPLTLGQNGSWAIASLAIQNAKTSVIKVVATDSLGNKGEAELSVLRDSDPPLPPVSLSNPASPTNVATASWTWEAGSDGAAGSGLSGKYRWKLNAGAYTEVATAAATGVALAAGSNVFSVQEEDKAGNWSAAISDTVVLDNKAPDAVSFPGTDSAYTDDATPTWTWTPSTTNGGIAEYVVKLGAGAEFTLTTTSYTPAAPLADNANHTLTVRQKDQVPGVVGAAKTFTYKVKVNPPGAPTVKSAVAALANNGLTKNPGFTWTSGGGGNGKYRVKVNAETAPRVNGVAGTTFTLGTNDADGIYKISVSEQDDLQRYGPEGTFTITLDRTAPKFANAKIAGKSFTLRDGFITNAASLAITYTSDGTAKSFTCALTEGAAKLCKDAVQTDAAGNTAAFETTVWSRSKVVFFTPTGTGDGSSWDEAASDIQAHVDAGGDGKEFWLASGNYTTKNASLTIWGITLNLIGGFFFDSHPTDTQNRNKGGTILAHISTMGTYGTWDGIQFGSGGLGLAMGSAAKPAKIIDCEFKARIQTTLGAVINFQNCKMIGVTETRAPLNLGGSAITWDGGAIQNNPGTEDGYGIEIISGTSVTFKGTLTISGNAPTFSSTQIYNDGDLEIATSVTFPCSNLRNGPNASGNCRGTAITPVP